MIYAVYVALVALALSALVLITIAIGRREGVKHRAAKGLSPLEGAVFGLMGLLLAFTFSGAAERFDARRRLIVEESNAISTAYLRIDLLPLAAQPAIRENFRRYVDTRLAIYRKLPDLERAYAELARARALQNRIWTLALNASYQATSVSATMLTVNALNQMFEAANERTGAARMHPHVAIYVLLVVATLVSALLAGHGMGANETKSWVHVASFAAMLAVTSYVILEIEYPRVGLIRVDTFDSMLLEARRSMN